MNHLIEHNTMKPREILVADFEASLVESGEDPAKIDYFLRPDNLDKFSDQDLIELTLKYQKITETSKRTAMKIAEYKKMQSDGVDEIVQAVEDSRRDIVKDLAEKFKRDKKI